MGFRREVPRTGLDERRLSGIPARDLTRRQLEDINMQTVFSRLGLSRDENKYEKLSQAIHDQFLVKFPPEEIHKMEEENPSHNLLEALRQWPWKYETGEVIKANFEKVRKEAEKAGLKIIY